jgi:hypothetical protein
LITGKRVSVGASCHQMFIARQRTGRTPLPAFKGDLEGMESDRMQVSAELGRQLERSRRSVRELCRAFVRAMPTRCTTCGGRVVRTDPMAAKSCNGCGRWAE